MEAAGGEEIGGSVSFVATWTGVEQEALDAMLAPFIEATGISIDYTGTRDLDAILTTRVAGNNPPDLAAVANPGIMAQFGREGELVDLSTVLDMDTFGEQYAEVWQELGSVDGTLNGLFMKAASKGFIWYNVGAFEDAGARAPSELAYVRLKANGAVIPETVLRFKSQMRTAGDMSEDAWSRLEKLVAWYQDESHGYLSRALPFKEHDTDGDYDHLARVLEWSAGGETDEDMP